MSRQSEKGPYSIFLYCNWGVHVDKDKSIWLPAVHYNYIKALESIGYKEITLMTKTCHTKRADFDTRMEMDRINIIALPWFDSYTAAVRNIFKFAITFKQIKLTRSTRVFIRVWEPFTWLLVLRLVFSKNVNSRKAVVMHFLSEPISAIFGHPDDSLIKKWARLLAFMPEYFLTLAATWACRPTCNGPLPKAVIPKIFSYRFKEVIDSALTEENLHSATKGLTVAPLRPPPNNLLFVGFLRTNKGIEDLLNATKSVVNTGESDFCLYIVGTGEYEDKAKSFISANNLTKNIKMLGYIPFSPELFNLYKRADIFINPSWSEAGPRVILEAKVFQNFIVSTDVGYVDTIIENPKQGLIVPVGDVGQLSEAILHALQTVRRGAWSPTTSASTLSHGSTAEDLFRSIFDET